MIPRRAALALPLVPRPARAQAPLLRVGSKNFTEQLVLGELWAQALEAAGIARVERRLNLGGTLIAQGALTRGQIDLYPEYTGTGLGVVLREDTAGTAEQVLARVREGYRARFNLDWVWDGKPALLQSRAVDDTGYVQPTYRQLRAVRGTRSIYHNNAIQTWLVQESGEVKNVQLS